MAATTWLRDPQQHRTAVPGQRQRRGTVAGQRHPATGHARGQGLGRVGEQLAAGAVAQRLGVQLVGEQRQIDAQPGVHGVQRGQARGQIAAQPELVGDPQPRRQHRDAPRRAVAQRTLVRRHHDHPRAPAHPGRGGPDQGGIAGVVARDDQHVERPDPRRGLAGDHDRLVATPPSVAASMAPAVSAVPPAGHPDHAARAVVDAQRIQRAFVDRGGDGAHLRAGHRRGPQQTLPVGGEQALGVFEIDRPGGVHGPASSGRCLRGDLRR